MAATIIGDGSMKSVIGSVHMKAEDFRSPILEAVGYLFMSASAQKRIELGASLNAGRILSDLNGIDISIMERANAMPAVNTPGKFDVEPKELVELFAPDFAGRVSRMSNKDLPLISEQLADVALAPRFANLHRIPLLRTTLEIHEHVSTQNVLPALSAKMEELNKELTALRHDIAGVPALNEDPPSELPGQQFQPTIDQLRRECIRINTMMSRENLRQLWGDHEFRIVLARVIEGKSVPNADVREVINELGINEDHDVFMYDISILKRLARYSDYYLDRRQFGGNFERLNVELGITLERLIELLIKQSPFSGCISEIGLFLFERKNVGQIDAMERPSAETLMLRDQFIKEIERIAARGNIFTRLIVSLFKPSAQRRL